MSLSVESGCIDCAAGRYSKPKGADSIDACVNCQPGKKGDVAKTGADDESSCTPCDAHTYSDQSGSTSCTPVEPGHYRAKGGSASILVPYGSMISDDKSSFQACPTGFYGEVPPTKQCLECPVGYSSSKAATECQPW